AVLLATPPQRAQPDALHIVVECSQCRAVSRHGMIGEEASDHLLEPGPLLGDTGRDRRHSRESLGQATGYCLLISHQQEANPDTGKSCCTCPARQEADVWSSPAG